MFKRWLMALLIAATSIASIAPASAQVAATPPAASPVADDSARATVDRERYILGRGDVVEVSVIGRPEYIARVQIQEDGTILLPFINNVRAAGRSVLELREEVRAALVKGQYFANPAVNIVVTGFASRFVTVQGKVATPSNVSIDRAYRVSEIIAKAGGPVEGADVITLTRPDGTSIELSAEAVAKAGPEGDPVVQDGDKIFVSQRLFYINGQVARSGAYPITRGMTVQMALSVAGGLTPIGSSKRIKLTRKGQEIGRVKLNEVLQPDDVIMVGERFF